MQPKLLDVNRVPSRPKKRKTISLVFDETKRRDFLTGFRKRKLQRRQQAQEKIKQQLKEERKRIKQEAHEHYKQLVSSRDIPEIQQLLSQREYETEGHTISILELNVDDLVEKDTLIGENKGAIEEEDQDNEDEKNNSNSEQPEEEIEGMHLNGKNKSSRLKQVGENAEIENGIDFKKAIRKTTLQQIKKSKAFKQQQQLDRQKGKKESMRKLKRKKKALKNEKQKRKLKR